MYEVYKNNVVIFAEIEYSEKCWVGDESSTDLF